MGLARAARPAVERRIYAAGLLLAALVYVGFAFADGAAHRHLSLELAVTLGFGAIAGGGMRAHAALLGLGWSAHVLWDVLLRLGGAPGAAYTPGWYAWLCISFDLVLAGALLARRCLPTGAFSLDHQPGPSVAGDGGSPCRTDD